jgi:hypothetical protein
MNNLSLSYKRIVGSLATVVVVLLAVVIAASNLASRSITLAPIPTASMAYNAHPGKVSVPSSPALSVSEHDNIAYVTWRDQGAVGVSSVALAISAGPSCAHGANWFYQHSVLTYSTSKNVDQATSQPIAGRPDRGNTYWQYAPGNTYSATITVTNAAGTSVPSYCAVFGIPQNDPQPAT